MGCLELDARLIELTTEYHRKNNKYAELEEEIWELESDRDKLGFNIDILEREIEKTRELLLKNKTEQLNVFTDDPFTNDFIKASYFADKSNDCNQSLFQYIHITDSLLVASDQRRLIVIKNGSSRKH